MTTKYFPGVHGVGLCAQTSTGLVTGTVATAFSATAMIWLMAKDSHDYDRGIEKQARTRQQNTRQEPNLVVVGGRNPTLNLRGDVDGVEFPLLLWAYAPGYAAGTYTAGLPANMGAPDHYLCARVSQGETDGTIGIGGNIIVDELYNVKVTSIRQFFEEGTGKLKYEAALSPIISAIDQSIAYSTVTVTNARRLFSKGGCVVTTDGTTPKLETLSWTLTNAGDPSFTTVTANQANPNGATDATGHSLGAIGQSIDAMAFAYNDPDGSDNHGKMYKDFTTNAAVDWVIVCNADAGSGGIASYTYTINDVQYMTGNITNPSPSQQENVSGVGTAGVTVVAA
jgi:hypothetical protein